MTASFDKLIIDNEIIGMVMRAVEGIEVNEKTLAFDVMKQAGPGGHFVSSRHTRRFMRKEFFKPSLSDREDRERWNESGAKDAWTRATQKVQEILEAPSAPVISDTIRDRIKKEIPGIEPSILN